MTGPDGEQWSWTFDVRGRMTKSVDPDSGTTTMTYDDADQLVSSTDDEGRTVTTSYDPLGRTTKRKAEGTVLSSWRYDTLAKGTLTSSTRHTAGGDYVSSVARYDELYRPRKTVLQVPTGDELVTSGAVAATGAVKSYFGYNLDGTPSYVVEPKMGGLPYERVGTYYDEVGNPSMLRGTPHQYVTGAGWSPTGMLSWANLEVAAGSATRVLLANVYETGTDRLVETRVKQGEVGWNALKAEYRYDDSGQVTSLYEPTSAEPGSDVGEMQCFSYDGYQRLEQAWTPDITGHVDPDDNSGEPGGPDLCAAGPDQGLLGGPAAYWNTYAYDDGGIRTATVRRDGDGSVESATYGRGGAGVPAHAVTAVSTSLDGGPAAEAAYGYDATGRMTSRPGLEDGSSQELSWDVEGRLASVTDPQTGVSTEYVYDADGGLLIRRTTTTAADGSRERRSVLYAGQTEAVSTVGLPPVGEPGEATGGEVPDPVVTARRSYRLGGLLVATRDKTADDQSRWGRMQYVASDHHGTSTLALDPLDGADPVKRYLDPFGLPRGDNGNAPDDDGNAAGWVDDKGFLGKVTDTSVGLTYVGARAYDPALGMFIAVDPVLAPMDPQSLNGYAYANNNPVTHSDPTGLFTTATDNGYSESPTQYRIDDGWGDSHSVVRKSSGSGAAYSYGGTSEPFSARNAVGGALSTVTSLADMALKATPPAKVAQLHGIQTPQTPFQDLGDKLTGADRDSDSYQFGSDVADVAGILLTGGVGGGRSAAAAAGRASRASKAANGARVFASTDAHVASAANSIEAALPGRVVEVNSQRAMSNGLTREVDIDLGDLLVQVKSGNARGLTGQIARTQASTGTRTIGYAPDISDAAWRNAAQQGIPILRSPSELLAYIGEFG